MISQTKQRILDFLKSNPDSTLKEILDFLGISKQATSKHLGELLEQNLIYKKGKPPKVYYSFLDAITDKGLSQNSGFTKSVTVLGERKNQYRGRVGNSHIFDTIEDNFYFVEPSGNLKIGWEGFESWCLKRGFDPEKYVQIYGETLQKYNAYKNNKEFVDAGKKFRQTYGPDCFLDSVLYSEFSALEIFGKTKLYSQLLYAKQSQDKKLLDQLVDQISEPLLRLIIQQKIEAIGFIPPTIPRKVQFMKELEKKLNLPLPTLKIDKIKGSFLVPQKTLKNPLDRIENAISTFVVLEKNAYSRVLLIDDFVGSGATLNFVAQKLKNKIPGLQKVIGYAICGTPNGIVNDSKEFEVIQEV